MEARAAKFRRETRWYPTVVMISGMTAGAAMFAAGGGVATLVFHLLGKF
jgi:hypothetical protein